jgi:hypothetical protein
MTPQQRIKFLGAYEAIEPERKRIAALFNLLELHKRTEFESLVMILDEFYSKNP